MIICKAQSVLFLLVYISFVWVCFECDFELGVDFKVKVMEVAGPDGRAKRVKVTIWDTGHLTIGNI